MHPEEYINLKVSHEHPEQYSAFLRAFPGARATDTENKIILDYPLNHCEVIMEKMDEGFWIFRLESHFRENILYDWLPNETSPYFVLDYLFTRDEMNYTRDGNRFAIQDAVILSNNKTHFQMYVKRNGRLLNYRMVFTLDYLTRNTTLTDNFLEQTEVGRVFNYNSSFYLRVPEWEEEQLLQSLVMDLIPANEDITRRLRIKKNILNVLEKFLSLSIQREQQPGLKWPDIQRMKNVAETLQTKILEGFPGVESLAAFSSVSVSKFKRDFKAVYDTSPFDFFRKLQMDYAETCINQRKFTIKEIAAQLGFENPSNFTSCFKKFKGVNPSGLVQA